MTASDLDRISEEITAYQSLHPERHFVPTETEASTIKTVIQLIEMARKGIKAPSIRPSAET